MQMLKRGDPCPICGAPIQTDDPADLMTLTLIKISMDRLDERLPPHAPTPRGILDDRAKRKEAEEA